MSNAGRKPMAAATLREAGVIEGALQTATHAADQFQALQASYGQERDLLNQLLGQAQMADSFAKFSQTVWSSKLAFVKENKLYQQLRGAKTPNGLELAGTWTEFCGLLGVSDEKANQDIANLKAFGEEALESMSRMGIGYREMRQYRKLPEDQKLALVEAAKAGDKESFVDLAEEIIARHAKEKEALTAQVQEAQETIEAKDRVLESKAEMITRLEEQTSKKFKPRKGSEARSLEEEALETEIQEATTASLLALRRVFKVADAAIEGAARDAMQVMARQSVEMLCQQLVDISTEFGITVNFEERLKPVWMSAEAIEAMAARQAEREAAGQ
ncbi:hypothetical protein N5K37_24545 [Delftia tsuruhatensis]|uniref:hypothetical protein n=1 Tax=Delftia tsuruhatensis TaxID=180282 RepID=UPI001CB92B7E|nr:hypothetical protein [Delftia tsuruhatensis]MDH2233082.1 hypothetical protein [Delftia tsuruhatensis]